MYKMLRNLAVLLTITSVISISTGYSSADADEEFGSKKCPTVICNGTDGCLPLVQSEYVHWFTVPIGQVNDHNYVCKEIWHLDNNSCDASSGHINSVTTYNSIGCFGR